MVNEENMTAWLDDLRTTDAPQVNGHLMKSVWPNDSHTYGYCCLGRGCVVMGMEPGRELIASADVLPPGSFVNWLGVHVSPSSRWPGEDEANEGVDYDLYLDIPEGLYPRDEAGRSNPNNLVTCAGLNDDWHLTFSQIADMIAYFGIHHAEPTS